MASQYPDALDTTSSLPNRSSGDLIPSSDNNDKNAALIALEKKVGIGTSDAASATTGQVSKKQANGTTAWSSLAKADVGLSNVPNTDATNRANHTGTQSADTLTDGTTNKAFTATERTKLAGVATGATANDTDANLKNRANHTGTQAIDTITGLQSALDAKSAVGHTHDDRYYTESEIDQKFDDFTPGDSLPDQSGNSGKFLKTDGTSPSWASLPGGGDMAAATYDPNAVAGDAFDMANMAEADDAKIMTASERSKLAGIEASADVTDAGNVASAIHGSSAKTTPVDADTLALIDSAASNGLKKLSWSNVKATLKTYFDTLYASISHTHNASDINAGTLPVARGGTGKSSFTSGRILTGNGTLGVLDTLSVNTDPTLASNSDSDLSTTKATKAYADSIASGLDLKASVRAATTTAGTLSSSFANGQTIDGVALVTGDRILIKNQSTASENGIYVVNASGAPTRASDANSSAKVTAGMFTYVEEGTANADKGFALTTNNPITLGTTALVFSPFNNGTGTPGGSDKQIQINADGAFSGSANLAFDESGVVPILAAKARVELGDVIIGANEYTPTVVYVGDSLTYGIEQVGVDYPYNHYIELPTWNGMTFEETNIGVGGLTLYKMKERMAKYQNVLYHQKSPLNIMVVWGGINDLAIANGAHSPQETYSVMAEFCRHARQLGWRVAVLTMISGDNGSENFDTSKNTYNGLLRTTWQDFADVLIDVAANPYLGADGAHSNGTYFLDGVHLTNTGYALVGSIVEEYLTAYIDQATTIKTHAVGFVRHGSNADYPRPLGYAMVIWDGSVQPNNMATYDQWVQPTS